MQVIAGHGGTYAGEWVDLDGEVEYHSKQTTGTPDALEQGFICLDDLAVGADEGRTDNLVRS